MALRFSSPSVVGRAFPQQGKCAQAIQEQDAEKQKFLIPFCGVFFDLAPRRSCVNDTVKNSSRCRPGVGMKILKNSCVARVKKEL